MRQLLLLLLLLLVSVSVPVPVFGQAVVLEDFASQRQNPDGSNLFSTWSGEDPGQTYSIEDGMLKVTGSPNTGCSYTGCGLYWNFLPLGPGLYQWPANFMQAFVKSGTFSPTTNRMRFKFKCTSSIARNGSYDMWQIGTYIKSHTYPDTQQGAHYYHNFAINVYANRWIWTEVSWTPTHSQGKDSNYNWSPDTEWVAPTDWGAYGVFEPVHYFDGLTRFYFDTQENPSKNITWSGRTCYFDDFTLRTETGTPENKFNTGLAGTYNGSAYEVAFGSRKGEPTQTYNIRYSQVSMKAAGFASGTDGGTVTNTGDAYSLVFWTSPPMPEVPSGLYVAMQPVGETGFSEMLIGDYSGGPGPDPPEPPAPTKAIQGSVQINGSVTIR